VRDVTTDPLADRYGRSDASRRRAVVLGSGLVGLIALAWLGWVVWFQSTPEVRSSLQSFEVVDVHTVTADVVVQPRSEEVRANCLVRAFAEDHSVVGELNFDVEDTGERTVRAVSFRTEREATSVELIGCTAQGQSRPR
jgi:hypothetical protein